MKSTNLNLMILLTFLVCCTWAYAAPYTTAMRFSHENNDDGEVRGPGVDEWPVYNQDQHQIDLNHDERLEGDFFDAMELSGNSNFSFINEEVPGDEPQNCRVKNTTYVDCTAGNLKKVPSTSFPSNILVFILNRNEINKLPEYAFFKYKLLQILEIQYNQIAQIDPLAFSGLSNLERLDLYGNKLVMDSATRRNAFSDNVFAPLKNLKWLRLNRNNPQPNNKAFRYPDKALAQLSSLETLFLDGFPEPVFESGFANLTLLRYLSLNGYKDGYCQLNGLKNETFRHMTSLQNLLIRDCKLQGHKIEAGTFLPLKKLYSLDVSHNQDINVQFFDRLFYGLQNTSTLKYLYMKFVVNLYTLGVCLSSKYIKYFPQSVEYLAFQENKIECIDRSVMSKISKSLKVIDISKNNFVFGTYFLDFPKLTQLTTLIINDYVPHAYSLPKIYPFNPRTPELDTENCSLYESDEITGYSQKFILRLPPNLKTVHIEYASMKYILSRLIVDENNTLEEFALVGNYIPALYGPIYGIKKIKSCKMMLNDISYISDMFFDSFVSLEMLNLSLNNLGRFFQRNRKTKVFEPLKNLKNLDLSSNSIRFLGVGIFRGMNELRFLNLSRNPLIRFDPDISQLHNLQSLALADTRLSILNARTRDFIDLRLKNGSFHVDMQQSSIFCDCENLLFLKWMAASKAFTFKSQDYRCKYPDSTFQTIYDGYSKVIKDLTRQCVSHETDFFVVASITCLIVLVIIGSLIYRYRWKLRYMYYATYLYLKPGDETTAIRNFEYDVFICYAEEDRDFVLDVLNDALEARGFKVFIHSRDFTAGEFIGSNIVRAVRTCRRTLVVLTRALAESSWCGYEIQMANMESAHRGYPVLIFLLKDDMTDSEMGVELLYNVRNNTYVPFPPEPDASEECLRTLWDKLATDIRK